MSNTVQYIITNIAVYCVITVCTCMYIYTYIKHLKIEIYYIGDQGNDFVLETVESDHIIHNFTHIIIILT